MTVKNKLSTEPQPNLGTRDVKILTLRIPVQLHEFIEKAAESAGQSLNQFISEAARKLATEPGNVTPAPMGDMAILIDADSFAGKQTIHIDAIEQLAATLGHPMIKSSFGTGLAEDGEALRRQLIARQYRHEELASRDALRLRITSEAIDITHATDVRDIMIVTADEELGALGPLLARRNVRIMAVGVRNEGDTKASYIGSFHDFRFYNYIARPPESTKFEKDRTRLATFLIQAAAELRLRDAKLVGATLIPLIRERHPDVSPAQVDFRSWKQVAEFAREQSWLSAIESSGADFLVTLSAKGLSLADSLLHDTRADTDRRDELELVRRAVTDILGIELPGANVRFLVFNATQWILNEDVAQDGVSLVDLSYRVASHLALSGTPQNTIYRLLNGLYRCGAFEFRANPDNEHDPQILRSRIPVLSYDDAFLLNLLRNRKKKIPTTALPENISAVFYGTSSHAGKTKAMLTMAEEGQVDRANLPAMIARLSSKASTV